MHAYILLETRPVRVHHKRGDIVRLTNPRIALAAASLIAVPLAGCDAQAGSTGPSVKVNQACESFDASRLAPRAIPASLQPDRIKPPIGQIRGTTADQGSSFSYRPVWWDSLRVTTEQARAICGKHLKAVVINWSNVDQNQAFESGVKSTFAELGIEVLRSVNYNYDPAQLQSGLSAVLQLHPDILVVGGPMNPKQYSTILEPAVAQGVKLVSIFNAGSDPSWDIGTGKPLTSLVSYDFYTYGYRLGEAIGERYPTGATFGYIHWINDVGPIQLRERGMLDALKKYPNIKVVADGGDPDPAGTSGGFADPSSPQAATTAFLQKHPDVNVLFAAWEDPVAIGEAAAVTSLGKQKDVDLVTMDFGPQGAAQLKGAGPITGETVPPMYDLGYAAAVAGALASIGATVPPYILAPTAVASKDNVTDAWSFMHGPDIPCCR